MHDIVGRAGSAATDDGHSGFGSPGKVQRPDDGASLPLPRVLVVTNMWPSAERPAFGSFVAAQVDSIRALGVEAEVMLVPGFRGVGAYFSHAPAVARRAARWRADVIHAHYGLTGWTASWCGLPLITSFCGDDLLGAATPAGGLTLRSRVAVRLSRWAARRSTAIICKSENLRRALPRAADRARAHVLPNGVDLARFHPGPRGAARARLALPADAPLVLFPHSPLQFHQKRFGLARAAIAQLRHEMPTVRLLEVSGVPPGAMPDWYRAADCLLLTSRTEGSPNTVKEALACGLPVVGVDAGDVAHWVSHPGAGEIVAADPAAIAAGLRRVLTRGARFDPAPIEADLDQRAVARRLIEIYQHVHAA